MTLTLLRDWSNIIPDLERLKITLRYHFTKLVSLSVTMIFIGNRIDWLGWGLWHVN